MRARSTIASSRRSMRPPQESHEGRLERGVGHAGTCAQLRERAAREHAAGVEDEDARSDLFGVAHLMNAEQEGRAGGGALAQEVEHAEELQRIERAERFVEDDDGTVRAQR